MRILLHENGTGAEEAEVSKIVIPDVWHIAMTIKDKQAQDMVLDVWNLAHDMKRALLNIDSGADITKLIHTK